MQPLAANQPERAVYTLEITGKAIAEIEAARSVIPPGTPINIAFLGNEDHDQRIAAARVIRACGFEPAPIISSRRLLSQQDRDALVGALVRSANPQRFILVGGDPAVPAGPYRDSLALLESGILQRHSIRHVGIVGYPEGHPKIAPQELDRALKWKIDFLQKAGCATEITTQFGFDADAIVQWIERLRIAGIDAPIRAGVPGPATVGKLLRYARQFGVASSAAIARRYGFSLANLLTRVGPDRFVDRLYAGMAGRDLGVVLFHLYPFGGIADSVDWMNGHLSNRPPGPFASMSQNPVESSSSTRIRSAAPSGSSN